MNKVAIIGGGGSLSSFENTVAIAKEFERQASIRENHFSEPYMIIRPPELEFSYSPKIGSGRNHSTKNGYSVEKIAKRRRKNKNKKTHRK